MSFNLSGSSSTRTVSFAPPKINVEWDGESQATLQIGLNCASTGATYVVTAYRIFPSDGAIEYEVTIGGEPGERAQADYEAGERRFDVEGGSASSPIKSYASDSTWTPSVSGTVASVAFSGLTASFAPYSWRLKATVGGVARVLAFGKLSVTGFNPENTSAGVIDYVSGTTVTGCF